MLSVIKRLASAVIPPNKKNKDLTFAMVEYMNLYGANITYVKGSLCKAGSELVKFKWDAGSASKFKFQNCLPDEANMIDNYICCAVRKSKVVVFVISTRVALEEYGYNRQHGDADYVITGTKAELSVLSKRQYEFKL